MKMMATVIAVLMAASHVMAGEFYYFAFHKDDTSKQRSSFISSKKIKDLSVTYSYKGENKTMVYMEVSQVQYAQGFASISEQDKQAAIDLAIADESDYEKWDPKMDAVVSVMTDELNAIRAHVGLPELKKNDVKKALKEKLKNK